LATVATVVGRVADLPLVRSACEMASDSYAATKETHPAMKAVCDVAETGVRAITSAAVTGAQPILDQLESQIAAANEYACKGLDTLEGKLPVLQQTVCGTVCFTQLLLLPCTQDTGSNTGSSSCSLLSCTMTEPLCPLDGTCQAGRESEGS
uniref:PLIN3 protein n=1 Tax=Chrysemys picta bellii TaxID=8478 RepID=A0A8C3FI37_CHRPI